MILLILILTIFILALLVQSINVLHIKLSYTPEILISLEYK